MLKHKFDEKTARNEGGTTRKTTSRPKGAKGRCCKYWAELVSENIARTKIWGRVEESNGESHVVTDKKQRGRGGKRRARRGITEIEESKEIMS